MKKNLAVTLVLCLYSVLCFSQKVLTVDFDMIKARIENKNSSFYYPSLLERFENGDSTLTDEECDALYYGEVFQTTYNPYASINPDFLKLYNAQKYEKALSIGLKALSENPVNASLTFKIIVCYHQTDKLDSAKLFARRYFALLKPIYNSGEGTSLETAMVVTKVSDEYEILKDSELGMVSQALIGTTDKLILNEDSQKKAKVDALYFNVQMPFESMSKMFESDSNK